MTKTTKTCGTIYTSRDGGSELVCTEKKGHNGSHYAGVILPANWTERDIETWQTPLREMVKR